jgi:phosphoribosyl-ATP pyrophosphohydrolase
MPSVKRSEQAASEEELFGFDQLYELIRSRHAADPAQSYVASLQTKGLDAILKKIGEESAELVIAAKNPDRAAAVHELADLWFHMMVWMAHAGITLDDLRAELGSRHRQPGRHGAPGNPS